MYQEDEKLTIEQITAILTLTSKWVCETEALSKMVKTMDYSHLNTMRRAMSHQAGFLDAERCDVNTKKPSGHGRPGGSPASTLWRLNAKGLNRKKALKVAGWYLADAP